MGPLSTSSPNPLPRINVGILAPREVLPPFLRDCSEGESDSEEERLQKLMQTEFDEDGDAIKMKVGCKS